jgi:hypothetical protein
VFPSLRLHGQTNFFDAWKICPWNSCDRHDCNDDEWRWWDEEACTVKDCKANLKARTTEAITFLYERIQANKGGNLIVNNHYVRIAQEPLP